MIRLSNDELAEHLQRITPGELYGAKLFAALMRLMVSACIEAVALRRSPDGIEVLMRKRGPNDSYPHHWHCPGTHLRPGETFESALARLNRDDALGRIKSPALVGNHAWNEERGTILSMITLVTLASSAPEAHSQAGCVWFPVCSLPVDTVPEHANVIIPAAVKFFEDERRTP